MEAAISSSLSHPNIVQTYTYTIRPMRDNSQHAALTSSETTNAEATYETTGRETTSQGSGGSSNVHSYEVSGPYACAPWSVLDQWCFHCVST